MAAVVITVGKLTEMKKNNNNIIIKVTLNQKLRFNTAFSILAKHIKSTTGCRYKGQYSQTMESVINQVSIKSSISSTPPHSFADLVFGSSFQSIIYSLTHCWWMTKVFSVETRSKSLWTVISATTTTTTAHTPRSSSNVRITKFLVVVIFNKLTITLSIDDVGVMIPAGIVKYYTSNFITVFWKYDLKIWCTQNNCLKTLIQFLVGSWDEKSNRSLNNSWLIVSLKIFLINVW